MSNNHSATESQTMFNGVVEMSIPEQEPCLQKKNNYDLDNADNISTTKVPPTDETRLQLYEEYLKGKTGLSRTGLIVAFVLLCVLLIVFIIAIVLAACWPKTPHAWRYPTCRSTQCLETSAKMLSMMNSSVDPCNDFWKYSCGTWLKDHAVLKPERSSWNAKEQEQYINRQQIRSLITTLPFTNAFASIHWKLKHFYESCMALEYIDTDKARPLKNVIIELGGWHVLREFSVLSWDYKRALERLHSMYGVSAFFKIEVVPDSRFINDSSQTLSNVIQISPAGLGFPDKSYYYRDPDSSLIVGYKRYLKDAVQALGATSVDANTFSVEMFHFGKRIAEIMPDLSELADPIKSYNPKTLSELKIIAPSIPLHEILLAKFPRAKIDDLTKIIVVSPAYLGNISLIISTTERSSLNNYLMWQLAEFYLPYLSQEFQDIVKNHMKETTGALHSLPRWEFCVATIQRFMGFAVASLQERAVNEKFRSKASDIVNEMFEAIRMSTEIEIKKSQWLLEDIKDQAMDKIIALSLQVGYPPDLLTDNYINNLYSLLPVKRSDLFTNIGYGITFLQASDEKRLNGHWHESWLDRWRDKAYYVPSEHKVVVPMWRALHALTTTWPSRYGTLGLEISSAIVSSVTPPLVLYKPRGDLLIIGNKAIEQSNLSSERAKLCLVNDASGTNLTVHHVTNKTASDTLIEISALKHAQKALTSSNFPHVHQAGMETLESEALFYIAYAQTLCKVSRPGQVDLDSTIQTVVGGQAMLQASLRQLQHFSDTFSCSMRSPYVSKHCDEIL